MRSFISLPLHWVQPLIALAFVTLSSIFLFFQTWSSIVGIWSRSDTFAHGYLVLPASLWLIWLRREQYKDLQPQFSWLGIFVLIVCGFIWLSADLVNVSVIKQWAVVGILVSGCWTVIGNRVALETMFPLLFLFLMVPFGEEFIPILMEYTATFVVTMLRLTGISVYREGMFFTLTSGNWSVVEGCSGLRYLIASLTLGTVYAYLNFSNYWKRLLFITASFVVPVIANGLRAYMIVMIGHLSSMKLATGVDHIIYGWVFFGLVMLLLFYIGSFWHDAPVAVEHQSNVAEVVVRSSNYANLRIAVLGIVVALAIWPWFAKELHARQAVKPTVPPGLLPFSLGSINSNLPDWGWLPEFKGVMADAKFTLETDGGSIAMYVANFGDETAGGELINSQNYLVRQKHPRWRNTHQAKTIVPWTKQSGHRVEESVLSSDTLDLFVMRWFRIGNINTSNNYYAKWLQFVKRLTGDAAPELMIVLYTQTPHGDYRQAREALTKIALVCCD